jgi:hypothetical protein
MYALLAFLAALAATATAKTVVINVGQSGLTFSPDSNTADVGDTLEFHFFGSIHSAVQGDFATPCQMSASGFDSGTIDNGADGSVSPPTNCSSGFAKTDELTGQRIPSHGHGHESDLVLLWHTRPLSERDGRRNQCPVLRGLSCFL